MIDNWSKTPLTPEQLAELMRKAPGQKKREEIAAKGRDLWDKEINPRFAERIVFEDDIFDPEIYRPSPDFIGPMRPARLPSSAVKAAVAHQTHLRRAGVRPEDIDSLEYLLVGSAMEIERAEREKQSARARKPRPKAVSPITLFIRDRLKRNPNASAKEIEDALFDDARTGKSGAFKLSDDGLTIHTTGEGGKRPRLLIKVASLPPAISEVRKKIL